MDSCLVDVLFLQTEEEEKTIFAKKVVISGITSNFKTLTKEINFIYPNQSIFIETDNLKSITFGNLELNKKEQELIKILNQFNTILVASDTKQKFISNYTKKRIVNFNAE